MCTIGSLYGGVCLEDFPFKTKRDFSEDEWAMLKLRSCNRLRTVCANHERNYLTFYEKSFKYCCNPLDLHSTSRKGDRVITLEKSRKSRNAEEFAEQPLVPGHKLCSICSTAVNKILKDVEAADDPPSSLSSRVEYPQEQEAEDSKISSQTLSEDSQDLSRETEKSSSQSTSDLPFGTPPEAALEKINLTLGIIEESPVNKRKLELQHGYRDSKVRKSEEKLHSLFEKASGAPLTVTDKKASYFDTMIEQLKDKFVNSTSSEKVLMLSVLPANWSREHTMEEFGPLGATLYMIRKIKELVKERGVLVSTNRKAGKMLPQRTVKLIQDFYEDDELSSRQMPGKNDYVSVKIGGQRVHKQKRLVLSNLKELYCLFKQKHPDVKAGFSKFAELRPKHCVLAGSAGTHSVCVCKYHQNFKLMIVGAQLHSATKNDEAPLITYQDCFSLVLCDPPGASCYLNSCCSKCPGIQVISDKLSQIFSEELTENIEYRTLTTVDRCTLETICQSPEDFIEVFIAALKELLPHDFLAKEQAKYLKNLKSEIKEGEAIIIGDFAENYTPIIQDAAPSYYWSTTQVTILPFVAYVKKNEELHTVCYAAVSDYMSHNVQAVFTFQKKFMAFLRRDFPSLEKVFYFSDGAASQFKNLKNIANCCAHGDDMNGVEAEWHFFATSHGKGPCDGVGGTLKRLAARASLQNTIIKNADQFYTWAKNNVTNIHVDYVTCQEVAQSQTFLEDRFKVALHIPGIQKIHACIPVSNHKVCIKRISKQETGHFVSVTPVRDQPEFWHLEVESYITVLHDDKWWLAQILNIDQATEDLLVELFHPAGNAKMYKINPKKKMEISIQIGEVLTIVQPTTTCDQHIHLSDAERAEATLQFKILRGKNYNNTESVDLTPTTLVHPKTLET